MKIRSLIMPLVAIGSIVVGTPVSAATVATQVEAWRGGMAASIGQTIIARDCAQAGMVSIATHDKSRANALFMANLGYTMGSDKPGAVRVAIDNLTNTMMTGYRHSTADISDAFIRVVGKVQPVTSVILAIRSAQKPENMSVADYINQSSAGSKDMCQAVELLIHDFSKIVAAR